MRELDNKINIYLSKDEAIVLFEFLSRFNQKENNNIFEHLAEERVLLSIECLLEKELSEPFNKDYNKILKLAREKC